MRYYSRKRRKRNEEAAHVRARLLRKFDRCMVCGHSPQNPWKDKPFQASALCCHEIARGIHRQKALDKPYAILVTCYWCNSELLTDRNLWPEARQLAVLWAKNPGAFDLGAYNCLINPRAPRRITIEEVKQWRQKDRPPA